MNSECFDFILFLIENNINTIENQKKIEKELKRKIKSKFNNKLFWNGCFIRGLLEGIHFGFRFGISIGFQDFNEKLFRFENREPNFQTFDFYETGFYFGYFFSFPIGYDSGFQSIV